MPPVRSSRAPSARYDEQGNLYLGFPDSVQHSVLFPAVCRTIASLAPGDLHDWEPTGQDVVWIDWRAAKQVERHMRTFWPNLVVTAEANPQYGHNEGLPEALAIFDADHSLRIYMPVDGSFCRTLERRIPPYARQPIDGLAFLPSAYRIDSEYAPTVLDSLAANWSTMVVTPEVGPQR